MKKNGFTLAELLGVIVILAAIALVAFPPIINQIKKSRGDLDDALNQLILSASEQYLDQRNLNKDDFYCISLNTLVKNGILIEPIIDSKGNQVSLSKIFWIDYTKTPKEYGLNNNDSGLSCTSKF